MANKQELLRYLDGHVFNPILKTKPDGFGPTDRRRLEDMQKRTQSEKERFHHYGSAEEVIDNYKSDLNSKAAKKVNGELEKLHLPTLPSVRDEFLKLAER